MEKQARVKTGAARPDFPYSDYGLEELNALRETHDPKNIPTTQTPKETYSKFRSYLKNGDIDGALSLIYERHYDDYKEVFEQVKKDNEVENLYKKLPENITEVSCYDTICTYQADHDSFIRFIKNLQGIWLIESL